MPLNKSCVGKTYPPVTTEVTLDAIQKYARACNDDNLAFFDANRPAGIVARHPRRRVAASPRVRLAASFPVVVDDRPKTVSDTGWWVIVQEKYDSAIGPAPRRRLGLRPLFARVQRSSQPVWIWNCRTPRRG